MIDPQETVAKLVLDNSECVPVFQRHKIDFCCRGDISIAEAAARRGLETAALVRELEEAIATRAGGAGRDPREMDTPELVEHVVTRHHGYLREALPVVQGLASKVSRVHGAHDPRLVELDRVVGALAEALLPHLDVEEETLFPAMTAEAPDRALLASELAKMQEEHLAVASLLERVRAITEDFRVPDWACKSYRALFSELEHLEADVHAHVHLENHVLAPRFADRAAAAE